MPSNSGKSRFVVNMLCHLAFVEHKKVLLISNEMTEDKMRLCLITTILKIWIVLGIVCILEPMGIITSVIEYINKYYPGISEKDFDKL